MDKVFRKRFFNAFDEMKTLYSELYGETDCFGEFCERLEKYYDKRPEPLKNLDLRREKFPNRYLDKVLSRLTFSGAVFLTIIALIPYILMAVSGMNLYFGGTSLLIAVGVALDTMKQIESHLLMRHYQGFMK